MSVSYNKMSTKTKIKPKNFKHLIELLNKRKIKLLEPKMSDDLIRYLKKKKELEEKYSDGKVTFP